MTKRTIQHLAVVAILAACVALVSAGGPGPAPSPAPSVDLAWLSPLDAALERLAEAVRRRAAVDDAGSRARLGEALAAFEETARALETLPRTVRGHTPQQLLDALRSLVPGVRSVAAEILAAAPPEAGVKLQRFERLAVKAATALRELGALGRVPPLDGEARIRTGFRGVPGAFVPEALVLLVATVGGALGSAFLSVVPGLHPVGRSGERLSDRRQPPR